VPMRPSFRKHQQRWPSGLRQLPDKQPYSSEYRGFESLRLRQRAFIRGILPRVLSREGLLRFCRKWREELKF
jgi:hypothetical protein